MSKIETTTEIGIYLKNQRFGNFGYTTHPQPSAKSQQSSKVLPPPPCARTAKVKKTTVTRGPRA